MEKRFILFIVLSFGLVMLTNLYVQKTRPPQPTPASTVATSTPAPGGVTTPQTLTSPRPEQAPPAVAPSPSVPRTAAPTVNLTIDGVYDIEFSTRGGVPVRWDIIDKRFVVPPPGESKKDIARAPVAKAREELIDPAVNKFDNVPHPFETVLQEQNAGFYNNFNTGMYKAEKLDEAGMSGYRFTSEPTESGLQMIKTYRFPTKLGSFSGQLQIELVNQGKNNLSFDGGGTGLGLILGPGLGKPPTGAAARFASADPMVKHGDKVAYLTPKKAGDLQSFEGSGFEWAAIQSMYFMTALIPTKGTEIAAAKAMIPPGVVGTVAPEAEIHFYPTLEVYGKPFSIAPGQTVKFGYEVFAGPKQQKVLKTADHGLYGALFYSSYWWMKALCLGLMAMLTWLHTVFLNWGVAIIMLTIIVRLVTFPLVQKGMKAQAKMTADQARLKPLLDKINEKFKDDAQRKQQETFKLYKEHGVNPFGAFKGCIWMFVQIPIFFALYKLLYASIDLRGATFLWVSDLSQPDRLFTFAQKLPIIGNEINLLPFITATSQMLASKFSTPSGSTTADPQQAQMQKMMVYFMPVFILFITYSFPAGLMLYWLVSNSWQVVQQLWVNKHMLKPPVPAGPLPTKAKA